MDTSLDFLLPDLRSRPDLAAIVTDLRIYLREELPRYEREHGIGFETAVTRDQLEPVWRRSGELGFYGINLPPELGGKGVSWSELCILKEEVAASGNALFLSVLGDMGGPLRLGSSLQHASAHQREQYFLPVVRGERACSFALTEENAGSDLSRMTTHAVRDGDDYILNGRKVFSTAAPFADFVLVIARTDTAEDVRPSYSAFLVDVDGDACRVEPGEIPMSGQDVEGDVVMRNCRVPARNMLGAEGEGLKVGLGRITVNRLMWSATILGLGRRCLELSVRYARERTVGGNPLLDLQAIQHMLAEMATDLYAARGIIETTSARVDAGEDIRAEAAMCKLFVANRCFQIADRAVQIHGKAGLTKGSEVEWAFRMLRMFRVLTGTDEILKNTVAKALQ